MTATRPISEDDLQAFVDDALDAGRRVDVEAFLAGDQDASARVAKLRMQREALRDAFAPVAREPLPPELDLARIIKSRRRPTFYGWRAVAAALALLIVGGGAGWVGRGLTVAGAPSALESLSRDAAVSFATFAPDRGRPVEIKAEENAALTRWVSNRLKRPVAAPDLASAGYTFLGGRVVATPAGPAGFFMYDDASGGRVVMLVRPLLAGADAPMTETADGPVVGLAWAKGGMGYSLVGEGAPASLKTLAEAIRGQTG